MIIDELFEGPQQCPECGGISFSDLILAEKKDACYYKVKASAKVWPSAYASGRLVQCRKKGAANYGNKSEDVEEDISRRGFLKGAGAAAVAGAAGNAMADRSWKQDELTKQWQGTMTSETFNGAVIHWDEERQLANLALTEPTNFSINNIKEKRLYFPKFTSTNFIIKIGNGDPINGSGVPYQFPLRQLGDYKGNGLTLFTGNQFTKIRDEFINADKVLVRVIVDGQPTTITFHDNPGHIQQRQTQKKQPILDKIYQEEAAGGRVSGFHGIYSAIQLRSMLEPYKDQIPDKFTQLDQEINTLLSNTQGHQIAKDIEEQIKKEKSLKDLIKNNEKYKHLAVTDVETVNRWLNSVYPESLSRLKKYNSMLAQQNESVEQDMTEEQELDEKWSQKYKSSINCANPKGFSQRAHCAGRNKNEDVSEGEQQKGADYRDPKEVNYDDEYDAMVARVKKLAGLGPMKTVYDPARRQYRNMPTAVQPKK